MHIFNYDFLALAMKEYYGLLFYTGRAYRVMYEKHECIRKVDTITFLSLHVSSNKFMKYFNLLQQNLLLFLEYRTTEVVCNINLNTDF
jgi:hypothetical protein